VLVAIGLGALEVELEVADLVDSTARAERLLDAMAGAMVGRLLYAPSARLEAAARLPGDQPEEALLGAAVRISELGEVTHPESAGP